MATTPINAFPYPVRTDPASGHTQIEALALALDSKIGAMDTAPDVQVFTANGTWTKPTNAKLIWVRVMGGGGAGGGAAATGGATTAGGAGGQAGGYGESWLAAAACGATETVTRGAGGTGVSGGTGNNGATSSFGSLVTAAGGEGGQATAAAGTIGLQEGGDDPTQAITAQIAVVGGGGDVGGRLGSSDAFGGMGGAGVLGAGGGGNSGSNTGKAGRGYGGGGAGSSNHNSQSARAGGAGANGVVIVISFF